jgi:hypothetical protein
VLDVDMIDGTPVLDIKPYLPYTDAIPDADHGWLEGGQALDRPEDPGKLYEVRYSELAKAQLDFLRDAQSLDLYPRIKDMLSVGPSPHPYRRIRKEKDGFRLSIREWRVAFRIDGKLVTVERVHSGYRPSQLFGSDDPKLFAHKVFVEKFGS